MNVVASSHRAVVGASTLKALALVSQPRGFALGVDVVRVLSLELEMSPRREVEDASELSLEYVTQAVV